MATLDSQGWIDFGSGKEPCAFFVRDEMLWVRRGEKYKCVRVGGSNTMAAARALAKTISAKTDHWVTEAHARKLGLPDD